MAGKLQDEIKQTKPFSTIETEALLALQLTSDRIAAEGARILKPWDLSPTQYNVLRILRGAGPDGLPCRGIGERMISRDPDMTRLLDRMEKGGLITRARQKDDRRVVKTQITEAGLNLLQKLDQPMRDLHKKQFQHMAAVQLKILGDLLDACRNRDPE
jgi:DNA-binding MarR family transcriptional regulator